MLESLPFLFEGYQENKKKSISSKMSVTTTLLENTDDLSDFIVIDESRINNGEFITFGKLLLKLKAPETISATKNISRNKTKNISECIKQNEQVSETEIVAENVNISPEECQENDTKKLVDMLRRLKKFWILGCVILFLFYVFLSFNSSGKT